MFNQLNSLKHIITIIKLKEGPEGCDTLHWFSHSNFFNTYFAFALLYHPFIWSVIFSSKKHIRIQTRQQNLKKERERERERLSNITIKIQTH
jgi:hypothetical protein